VLTAQTKRLVAGKYLVAWYSELRVTDESLGDGSQAIVLVNDNEVGRSINKYDDWQSFSGHSKVTVTQGEKVKVEIQFKRRAGPPAGVDIVKIRRKRIFINKISEDE